MIHRKTPSEGLLTLAIFLNMLTLVAYIISYHISCGKFKQRESKKLNVFFLRGKKGRLHGIIKSARCSLLLFFIAMLMMLVEANRGTGFIFVIACVFICMTIAEYYFFHQRQISEANRARSWKLLVLCFTGCLFFANMFSSQFILEAFDIEPARLTFTRWSFSLIIMLCLISMVTYFVQLLWGAFFPVVRRSRRKAMMALYDSMSVTSLLFSLSLFMLVLTWWSPLGNTLMADSSSKCNAKPPVLTLQRPLKAAG
ncbi:hypothetical protein, partial [Erwinia sp. V71]|uniref:hypothetical protein n=1 Tax=Erwinia sp. V71 TaxID=3369424 RepID=UPI003F634DA0